MHAAAEAVGQAAVRQAWLDSAAVANAPKFEQARSGWAPARARGSWSHEQAGPSRPAIAGPAGAQLHTALTTSLARGAGRPRATAVVGRGSFRGTDRQGTPGRVLARGGRHKEGRMHGAQPHSAARRRCRGCALTKACRAGWRLHHLTGVVGRLRGSKAAYMPSSAPPGEAAHGQAGESCVQLRQAEQLQCSSSQRKQLRRNCPCCFNRQHILPGCHTAACPPRAPHHCPFLAELLLGSLACRKFTRRDTGP